MRGVAQVLQIKLPVGLISMPERAARDLDLAVGRAIDHVVKRGRHMAEEFLEARALGWLAGKHETAIAFHPSGGNHRRLRVVRIEVARIAVLQRHRLEPAVEMIGPAVIATLKFVGIAFVVGNDQRTAVSALIVDDANFAFGIANENHGLAADEGAYIVAGLAHLALVADIDPGPAEYPFHLRFEDCRIGIESAVYTAGLHQGM